MGLNNWESTDKPARMDFVNDNKLLDDFMMGFVGTVMSTARTTAPAGWLYCQGQAVSRTTYARLFTAIGTTYGSGDGSSTFNLPDMRGRMPYGANGNLGTKAGSTTHILTTNEMPAHSHSLNIFVENYGTNKGGIAPYSTVASNQPECHYTPSTTGGSGAHNNMPPYLALYFIIKY